ncbi:stage 0 sporulation family protein [Mucilaginibacter sp. AW1-3]
MGCGSCSTGGCAPAGCKSNGSCLTNGCSKLDVYDWLSNMDKPTNYKPFQVVEVKFKGSRKEFFVNTENLYLELGELVAVETTTGGFDVGHISITGELVRMQMTKRHVNEADVVKKIYRKATSADVDKWKAAKDLEWQTMHKARTLALELGLQMKLSDVDYQGDKTKATFYYTAEGRVDFRELIKKMAEAFRIRIEMRQIGMRQEASRLGGIGSCGRELCCSTWLTDFKTVSTAAARYQNLSLNTLKLAGQCGKLKCCLNYELDTYMDALKHIPDNVNYLKTEKGDAKLQKTDIFKKLMWFSYPKDDTWVPVEIDRVKEIQKQNRDGVIPPDLGEMAELENKITAKVLDYENVVGQDSLTRLDERNKNRNNNNRNRNKNRGGNNQNPQQEPRSGGNNNQNQQPRGAGNNNQNQRGPRPQPIMVQNPGTAPVANQTDAAKPEGNAGGNNKRNKHRHRPNRNGKGGGNSDQNRNPNKGGE